MNSDTIVVSVELKSALFRSLWQRSGLNREELAKAARVKVADVRACETQFGDVSVDVIISLYEALGYPFLLVCMESEHRLKAAGYPRPSTQFTDEDCLQMITSLTGMDRWQLDAKFEELKSIPLTVPKYAKPIFRRATVALRPWSPRKSPGPPAQRKPPTGIN